MRILTSKRLTVLFISLVLIFALGVSSLMAQKKFKIAGKHTLAFTPVATINVGDTEDHIISLSTFEGANVSTGKNKFMDGAQDVGMMFVDLVKGNGPHQGYGQFSLNGDTIFWKHQGKTVTTLSPKGKPVTTSEGSWTYINGTGKYENIQGSGTYKGNDISKTISITEWEGEYFIKK